MDRKEIRELMIQNNDYAFEAIDLVVNNKVYGSIHDTSDAQFWFDSALRQLRFADYLEELLRLREFVDKIIIDGWLDGEVLEEAIALQEKEVVK